MTDAEILEGLLRQEPAALEAMLDAYATPVYGLVYRILAGTGAETDVEECVSDAFHTAWQQAGRYDSERAPLRTWLLNLAKYQALERRRGLLRRAERAEDSESPIPPPTPEDMMSGKEQRQAVQAALQQLPRLERELIYRRYFLEQRVEEAADALNLTRQAADNRLWRARKALRELLVVPGREEVSHGE